MRPALLSVDILPQPDDETCGPTCLQAVYQYWGDDISLPQVIDSVRTITAQGRGTLAVMLGIHALRRGYAARLYTFNVQVFDPTWFNAHGDAEPRALCDKLARQLAAKTANDAADSRLQVATDSYLEFLDLGGVIRFRDLNSRLISSAIRNGLPVLSGLSSTYLYRCAREFGPHDVYDDIRGEPAGHFVVLHGYDPRVRRVTVADPLANNPGFDSQRYTVAMARLVPAIMLGVLTYDANLLVIEPRQNNRAEVANKGEITVPVK